MIEPTSKSPRQYSLIRLEESFEQDLIRSFGKDHPFAFEPPKLGRQIFVYLGEIPNMLGHCVIAGYTSGKIMSGWHTDNFIELTDEEV